MKPKKVCIIGKFAYGKGVIDGQTVKTQLLYDELKKRTTWKIYVVDTYEKKKRIRLFLKSVWTLLKCKDVFISLSVNGKKAYFKILKFFIFFKKTRVYHYVIGGNHHQFLKDNPKFIKVSKKFMINWVETHKLVGELKTLGVENSEYIPNFKPLKPVKIEDVVLNKQTPFKFVIFSRINEAKGVKLASEVIKSINDKAGKVLCLLDCYGQIDSNFANDFQKILKENIFVRYKGLISPFESCDILKDYYALLFPTSYYGEGFAGTILDAFFSGLPVIASDWHCNSEIIQHMHTGLLYPSSDFRTLVECIEFAIENPDTINSMKKTCIEVSKEYTPDKYMNQIIDFVEKQDRKNETQRRTQ